MKTKEQALSDAISSGEIADEDKKLVKVMRLMKAPYSKELKLPGEKKPKTMWYIDLKCPCGKETTRDFEENPNGRFAIECDKCKDMCVVSIE